MSGSWVIRNNITSTQDNDVNTTSIFTPDTMVTSKIVGACGLARGDSPGEFVLSYLFVDPAWHRKGLGRALLRVAISTAEMLAVQTLCPVLASSTSAELSRVSIPTHEAHKWRISLLTLEDVYEKAVALYISEVINL